MPYFKLKLKKIFFLITHPYFLFIFLRHKVVPSIEHISCLRYLKIDTVYDVGANRGQFSLLCKYLYDEVKINSFEPLKKPFNTYKKVFKDFSYVKCYQIALGAKQRQQKIYVTKHDDSSSLLKPFLISNYFFGAKALYEFNIKVDVQGYELEVIKGFSNKIGCFNYIFVELSGVELYSGQPLYSHIINHLTKKGFSLISKTNEIFFKDKFIQADYLFINRNSFPNKNITRAKKA
ncbi:MAG: FkbM family methyltransferase [Methylophilaceae bacterium]